MRPSPTRSLLPLLAVACLALPACDSSPSEVVGSPVLFSGTFAADGGNDHYFVVSTAGGVRVEVLSIVAEPPLTEGFVPSMGIGLGQRDPEDSCQLTYSASVQNGFSVSFGLREEEYCVRAFDNGTVADDATRFYEVRVTPSG